MNITVDRKAFQAAAADLAKFRNTSQVQDHPTYIRISASKSDGFFLDAIHLIDGICYRRELKARIGTDETPKDELAVVYIDLNDICESLVEIVKGFDNEQA